MIDLKSLLEIAIQATQQANKVILEIYHSGNFEAEAKGDSSPLTMADKKSHQIISKMLEPIGIPILSEEGRNIPYEERKKWEYFWLVDPLDGTKEFLKKNGEFTVNIALIHHQEPVLGVVGIPVSGVIYYGANGIGAFKLNQLTRTKIQPRSPVNLKSGGIRVVASRSHIDEKTLAFVQSLINPQLVSKGSSIKFMLLVDGEADFYPRFAPTMEWDTAAAHGVLKQVGYQVISEEDGKPLRYNKENLLNPFFRSFA